MPFVPPWPKERVEQVKALWEQNFSCREIGIKIGATRNSIAGHIYRLHGKGWFGKHDIKRQSQPKKKRVRKPKPKMPTVPIFKLMPKRPPSWQARPCSLVELEPYSCRWPIGTPKQIGFRFCGAATDGEHAYCPRHCGKAYIRQPGA